MKEQLARVETTRETGTYEDEEDGRESIEDEYRSEENDDLADIGFERCEKWQGGCETEDAERLADGPSARRLEKKSVDLDEDVCRVPVIPTSEYCEREEDGEV